MDSWVAAQPTTEVRQALLPLFERHVEPCLGWLRGSGAKTLVPLQPIAMVESLCKVGGSGAGNRVIGLGTGCKAGGW